MVEEFARSLSLTIWDWLAVLIALLSLVIAIFSYVIARKTLKSQRQTEINTLPIINLEIQEFLFRELIIRLFDGHLRCTAIWYLLNENSYQYYISERFLVLLKIPSEIIHIELFYNNYPNYRAVQGLLDMIIDYNISIDSIINHLKDKNIDEEILHLEFRKLTDLNDRIALIWVKVMSVLFNYKSDNVSQIFNGYIKDISNDSLKSELHLSYYKTNEVYADFFEDTEMKKMLVFMDEATDKLKMDYSNYLIKRI